MLLRVAWLSALQERVVVVGECEALGEGDPTEGLRLTRSAPNEWEGKLAPVSPGVLQYKVRCACAVACELARVIIMLRSARAAQYAILIANGASSVWEDGEIRSLPIESELEEPLHVTDVWGSAEMLLPAAAVAAPGEPAPPVPAAVDSPAAPAAEPVQPAGALLALHLCALRV